jgi:ketosteroid isomerase-like protein
MGATEPEQVIDHFCRLFNSGDLDALVNDLYEDDAVFIPSPTDAPVSGRGGVAESLKGFLALGGTLSILVTTSVQNGEIALTHTRWRLDIPGAEAMEAVTAEIVRRQPDGTWKYAIDNPWGGAVLEAAG